MRPARLPMLTLLVIGSLFCCWALLRNVGNERERAIRVVENQIRVEREAAEAAAREIAAIKASRILAAINAPPPAKPAAPAAAPAKPAGKH